MGAYPFGGSKAPSNTMSPGPRPTSVPDHGRHCWLDVVGSDLERLVDALKFSQTGARPKPDHLRLLCIQLKSARRTPLADFRDTAGQTVSDRLDVNKCAAVVELCVICVPYM